VENADEILVKLANDKEYKAKILGRDPKTDIAVIKINAKSSLPSANFGDSDKLEVGDSLLACSDGLWHYFTPKELGAIVHALPPREASEMLVSKARQRARGAGDNLSLALIRIDSLT